jgi:hypothetical protein
MVHIAKSVVVEFNARLEYYSVICGSVVEISVCVRDLYLLSDWINTTVACLTYVLEVPGLNPYWYVRYFIIFLTDYTLK